MRVVENNSSIGVLCLVSCVLYLSCRSLYPVLGSQSVGMCVYVCVCMYGYILIVVVVVNIVYIL